MADEKGDGGKGRKRENGRCDDGRRGDFRLHGAGAPCADCNGAVRREGERFIFGLQTMLGTGEIAVKGAKV